MTKPRAPGTSRFRDKLFVALQYFLPQILLTRLTGWFMARTWRPLKNLQIRMLCRLFAINVDEADQAVPDGYPTLNAFFTRKLRPGARPLCDTPGSILVPCDGQVSESGRIERGQLMQAKGFHYSAAELLDDAALAERFDGGLFVTIYLAPYDYHRVHSPIDARVTTHTHVPGKLFSVNGATAAAVPRLFARNERRVFVLAGERAPIALVMVGALNVGSISVPWTDDLIAGEVDATTSLALPEHALTRGATLGWFNMGSTVIALLPPGHYELADHCSAGETLRMGEALALPADA